MGGTRDIDLGGMPGPWYSQDLTAATDKHPHWLGRIFYEELLAFHPKLKKYDKYFPKLFGPRRIVSGKKIPFHPVDHLALTTPVWEAGDNEVRLFAFLREGEGAEVANLQITAWETYLQEINALGGPLTTGGAMMGDHSSFPLLPMVSAWAGAQAGLPIDRKAGDDGIVPVGRHGKARVLRPNVQLSPIMKKALHGLDLDPQGTGRISQAAHRIAVYNAGLQECGGILSLGDPKKDKPNKIFTHPTNGMFCERPLYKGRYLPHLPVSLLAAPPGGSKGELNWSNQAIALAGHRKMFGTEVPKRLYRHLPYFRAAAAAFALGVPVREPVALGGILYPGFPHSAGLNPRRTNAWLDTVAQIRIADWATGTGLSPLPVVGHNVVRSVAKGWLEGRLAAHREYMSYKDIPEAAVKPVLSLVSVANDREEPLPSLREAAELATRGASSYMLYAKEPEIFLHTPSIEKVAASFSRRIFRKKPRRIDGKIIRHSYQRTFEDVQRKLSIYLAAPEDIPRGIVPRAYGLETGNLPASHKRPYRISRARNELAFLGLINNKPW
jgi:hypothetical protein